MSDTPTPETESTSGESTSGESTPRESTSVAPTPAAEASRRAVLVPVWALVALAVVVIGVGAFLVGRATAPDAGPKTLADAVEMTASGEMEVGEFDARALVEALRRNKDLDLGPLGNLILGQLGQRGARR